MSKHHFIPCFSNHAVWELIPPLLVGLKDSKPVVLILAVQLESLGEFAEITDTLAPLKQIRPDYGDRFLFFVLFYFIF